MSIHFRDNNKYPVKRIFPYAGADCILFMKNGKILTEGAHQELLSACEAHRSLAAMGRSGDHGNPARS